MKIYTNCFLNFGKTLTESTISYNKGEVLVDVQASAGLNVIHSTKINAQWDALQRYKVFLNLQWRTSPNSYFENGFKPNVNFNDQNNIKDNYLGFLVLRPLIACIGRNVINPKAKIGPERDSKICKVEIDSSCLGIKLKAVGFPHASQDNETMRTGWKMR